MTQIHTLLTPENINRWYSNYIEENIKQKLPALMLMNAIQASQKLSGDIAPHIDKELLEADVDQGVREQAVIARLNKNRQKVEIRTLSFVEALLDLLAVLVTQSDALGSVVPSQQANRLQDLYNSSIEASDIIKLNEGGGQSKTEFCIRTQRILSEVGDHNADGSNIKLVMRCLILANGFCECRGIDLAKITKQ